MNQQRKLQHLYWRAGFGLSPLEWRAKQHYSIDEAVERLFNEANRAPKLSATNPVLPPDKKQKKMMGSQAKKEFRKQSKKWVHRQSVEWIKRMSDSSESALLERMSLFWHGHFACITKEGKYAFNQLNAIRTNALGNFKDLLMAIAKDASMIRFLNNQQNKKRKPNENFARELMELFTIGRGNYTENDIKAAARAFTGWTSNFKGEFVFNKWKHDEDSKTFMGQRGNFNGDDIIDILLSKRETALFITTKIYRYFVNEKIDQRRVNNLADSFFNSNYNIAKLMKRIFKSNWFYDEKNIGSKIKSPVELLAGIMNQLSVNFEKNLAPFFVQKALGQRLFSPPNVAGWDGGKAWIDNATLMIRLNLVPYLFQAVEMNFGSKPEFEDLRPNKKMRAIRAQVNINEMMNVFNSSGDALFEDLSNYLLQSSSNINKATIESFTIKNNRTDYFKTLVMRLMSLPEYQMC